MDCPYCNNGTIVVGSECCNNMVITEWGPECCCCANPVTAPCELCNGSGQLAKEELIIIKLKGLHHGKEIIT